MDRQSCYRFALNVGQRYARVSIGTDMDLQPVAALLIEQNQRWLATTRNSQARTGEARVGVIECEATLFGTRD
jgi:hypothetical protein